MGEVNKKRAIKFCGMQSSGSESSMGKTGDRTKDELEGGLRMGANETDIFMTYYQLHLT